jgi:uncharacterized protein YdeI (YjbR/CyaY-like superfamily)
VVKNKRNNNSMKNKIYRNIILVLIILFVVLILFLVEATPGGTQQILKKPAPVVTKSVLRTKHGQVRHTAITRVSNATEQLLCKVLGTVYQKKQKWYFRMLNRHRHTTMKSA